MGGRGSDKVNWAEVRSWELPLKSFPKHHWPCACVNQEVFIEPEESPPAPQSLRGQWREGRSCKEEAQRERRDLVAHTGLKAEERGLPDPEEVPAAVEECPLRPKWA